MCFPVEVNALKNPQPSKVHPGHFLSRVTIMVYSMQAPHSELYVAHEKHPISRSRELATLFFEVSFEMSYMIYLGKKVTAVGKLGEPSLAHLPRFYDLHIVFSFLADGVFYFRIKIYLLILRW